MVLRTRLTKGEVFCCKLTWNLKLQNVYTFVYVYTHMSLIVEHIDQEITRMMWCKPFLAVSVDAILLSVLPRYQSLVDMLVCVYFSILRLWRGLQTNTSMTLIFVRMAAAHFNGTVVPYSDRWFNILFLIKPLTFI